MHYIEDRLSKNFDRNEDFSKQFLDRLGFSKTSLNSIKANTLEINGKQLECQIFRDKMCFCDYDRNDSYPESINYKIKEYWEKNDTGRKKPRIISTKFQDQITFYDTKDNEAIVCPISDLHNHSTFFLPLLGKEKVSSKHEAMVNIRVAQKIALLYDEVIKLNPDIDGQNLNVFFIRILFCYFAEGTDLFNESSQFTNSILNKTDTGEDLGDYLNDLFITMSDKDAENGKIPYVNGGIFKKRRPISDLSNRARQIMIECGEMGWSGVNPDIFGSMMQATFSDVSREKLGQHYTDEENILKALKPLFLDDCKEELNKIREYADRGKSAKYLINSLNSLLVKLSEIIIFDPACGSGNFLVTAYSHLRDIEIECLKMMEEIDSQDIIHRLTSSLAIV